MKRRNKVILLLTSVLLLAAAFALSALAATPSEGYAVNENGEAVNIKWTMTEDGTLTFQIDPSATDKVQTTVISNKDPLTGTAAGYKNNLPTYADAVKIVIGDGITELAGFSCLKNLKQVELAPSVTVLGRACFETNANLESVYIRGTEPVKGKLDLSSITKIDKYTFDGCTSITSVTLCADYKSELPADSLKNLKITELVIPEGTTALRKNALSRSFYLEVLTVLGMNTAIDSDSVFDKNTTYPKIKAKAGSKAEAFAKANGYTFIDIDTGEETKGTKTVTDASKVGQATGNTALITDFNPEGATAFGHSSGTNVDIWWAYYDDTKTLELLSGTTAYNETGTAANIESKYESWEKYKDVIEHLIIGDNIKKITKDCFSGYTALKDVRLGKNVNDVNKRAFSNCTSLTTIWRDGTEPVEGRADFSNLKGFYENSLKSNLITEVILPKTTTELVEIIDPTIQTLYVYNMTDALKEYAKTNYFNLRSLSNPDEVYDYWVYYDPTLPSCGTRSVYSFDEATGTLTVHGGGEIASITNFYGGGSRNQPWRALRNKVKHVVIGDKITTVGKYAFCEFSNLETVQIPDTDSFSILNAAFEKCYNLKSLYRKGKEPIEGTLDLGSVQEITSWSFAYTYLIANIIVNPSVAEIGESVFEGNLTLNLANVYGVPGSYAEEFASEYGLKFHDASSSTPIPISCTPPETTENDEKITYVPGETNAPTETDAPETEEAYTGPNVNFFEVGPDYMAEKDVEKNNSLPIILISALIIAVAAAAVAVAISIKRKK